MTMPDKSDAPLWDADILNPRYRGSIRIGTLGDVELYLNWSMLLGAWFILLACSFRLDKAAYYFFAFTLLITVHELGHLIAARLIGMRVFQMHVSCTGGHCRIQMPPKVRDAVFLFSAGLIAQALLLLATLLCLWLLGPPVSAFWVAVCITFTWWNFFIAIMSLIPRKAGGMASDGMVLWRLYLHSRHGHPHPFPNFFLPPKHLPEGTRPSDVPDMVPPGFVTGLEIVNDDKTPMEFVVTMLHQHLGVEREDAIALMMSIHRTGGILVPLESMARAQAIAALIEAEARAAGHPLVCRALDMKEARPGR